MSAAETRIHEAALRIFAERGVTPLTISELAEAAGVARGTVYNNLGPTNTLFEDIAARLADEMHERVVMSFVEVADPAQRLANGIRFFIRRAHEEPLWGRFIIRFALGNQVLQGMWTGPPAADLRERVGAKTLPYRSRSIVIGAGDDCGGDTFGNDAGSGRSQDLARRRCRRGGICAARARDRAKGSEEDRQHRAAAVAKAFLKSVHEPRRRTKCREVRMQMAAANASRRLRTSRK